MIRPIAALLITFASTPLLAAPIRVSYVVEESAGSWQPLEPKDVEKTIEHAALEVLSKSGLLQLERVPMKSLDKMKRDYVLEIRGRALDEAETHSVYLTFGPGVKTDLPSFRAADTVPLGKLARGAMLSAIDASARKAAAELSSVLSPQLDAMKGRASGDGAPQDPLSASKELPWRWAEVRVPQASAGRASAALYSKKHSERTEALRELTSLALTEASPRNTLETCVLKHPDKEIRKGCLIALRPLSRRIAPTQRVVIEALRKDRESDVVQEASEQMMYFSGLSRSEAAQAWLERAAKGEVVGPMAQLGDLPNLDLAIKSCLVESGKRPKYQRSKQACIEMLKPVSPERRRRLLWKHLEAVDPESPYYIEGAGEREGSIGTDWQWAVEAVLENTTRWDPALEEILWRRYQRTLSSSSLDVLAELAEPSERLIERMLEVVQTAGARQGLQGLRRIAKQNAKLRPVIRERLAEILATSAYPKSISPHDLETVVKELAPREDR